MFFPPLWALQNTPPDVPQTVAFCARGERQMEALSELNRECDFKWTIFWRERCSSCVVSAIFVPGNDSERLKNDASKLSGRYNL